MTAGSCLPDLLLLLFKPGEDPFFIDSTAPVEDIVHDGKLFINEASQFFGVQLGPEHLAMTVPQLTDFLNQNRTR